MDDVYYFSEDMLARQIQNNLSLALECKHEWRRRYAVDFPFQKLACGMVKYLDWKTIITTNETQEIREEQRLEFQRTELKPFQPPDAVSSQRVLIKNHDADRRERKEECFAALRQAIQELGTLSRASYDHWARENGYPAFHRFSSLFFPSDKPWREALVGANLLKSEKPETKGTTQSQSDPSRIRWQRDDCLNALRVAAQELEKTSFTQEQYKRLSLGRKDLPHPFTILKQFNEAGQSWAAVMQIAGLEAKRNIK